MHIAVMLYICLLYTSDCKLPRYLPKDGYTTLVIGFVRLNGNKLVLPFSNSFKRTHKSVEITIPPVLLDKKVKEIRIIPKANARFFEIQYIYEAECVQRNLNKNNALALDLGINNFVTAVSSNGKSFIVDGRRLKSINQWFNKENARLQSIKDKQHLGKKITNRQKTIARNRNNKVNDYLNKAARKVVDYCITNDIGTLVVGYNETFQRGSNIGKQNNQNFVNIPYGLLRSKLEYLCELNDCLLYTSISFMKLISTLSSSKGSSRARLNELFPVPKSSRAILIPCERKKLTSFFRKLTSRSRHLSVNSRHSSSGVELVSFMIDSTESLNSFLSSWAAAILTLTKKS